MHFHVVDALTERPGSSILLLVDIDAADVIEAVSEFFEDEKMSAAAVKREDV